jgi:hypothetical protein
MPGRCGRAGSLAATALAAVLLSVTHGCGYRMGFEAPAGVETVSVPVFDNRTRRREVELDLTARVAREIQRRTPLRVIARPESADLVVRGTITGLQERVTVEGAEDQVLSATSTMTVRIEIERAGAEPREHTVSVTVDLEPDTGVAGVSGGSLREPWTRLFELVAERIVMLLEA